MGVALNLSPQDAFVRHLHDQIHSVRKFGYTELALKYWLFEDNADTPMKSKDPLYMTFAEYKAQYWWRASCYCCSIFLLYRIICYKSPASAIEPQPEEGEGYIIPSSKPVIQLGLEWTTWHQVSNAAQGVTRIHKRAIFLFDLIDFIDKNNVRKAFI